MALWKGLFDLQRVWRAAGYSTAGFRAALRNEAAFRQELALLVVLAPLGFWFGRDGVERSLLVGSLLLVLLVELLNSAIESVVNRVGQDHHELSEQAKDIASAAVSISLLIVVVVWALVLTDRFL
ncbi:MAG TPA: diacylglycerol kinase [Sulfuricaulis sp.]